MGREQAWPLSTSILTAPSPFPQAALKSVVGQDGGGGGGRVNIFKCLRYVLVLNWKDKAFHLISQPS